MRQGDHSGSPLPVRERHGDGPHCLPLIPVDRTPSLTSEQEQTRLAQKDPKQLLGGAACVSIAPCEDLGTNSLPQLK